MYPPLLHPTVGYPVPADVRLNVLTANSLGTLASSTNYASAANVLSGIDRGDGTLGTYQTVSGSNVRSGISFGAAGTSAGSIVMPAAQYVYNTQTFDNGTQGSLTLTSGSNVIGPSPVFGIGGTSVTSSYVTVIPANVRLGTQYGPSSSLTGLYAGSGTGGGGIGTGTGTYAVNHNTGYDGSTVLDNMRTMNILGEPVGGVTINAYLASDYAAGNTGPSTIKGQTTTGPDGRWLAPLELAPTANYLLVFSDPGQYNSATNAVTLP